MRLDPVVRSALSVLMAGVAGLAVSACSNSTRLTDKPQWSLTGGRDTLPAAAPAPVTAPGTGPQYQGGRDPVTGRAPAWGARPDRVEQVPLPVAGAQPAPLLVPGQAPTTVVAGAPPARHNGRPIIEVRPGDSLASIAQTHRVSIGSLMFVNGLRDAYVSPGQRLALPPR